MPQTLIAVSSTVQEITPDYEQTPVGLKEATPVSNEKSCMESRCILRAHALLNVGIPSAVCSARNTTSITMFTCRRIGVRVDLH